MLEIADDSSQDFIVNEEGKIVVNNSHLQRAKLRIEVRRWMASKLKPKRYGDRIQADIKADRNRQEGIKRIRELVRKRMLEKMEAEKKQANEVTITTP